MKNKPFFGWYIVFGGMVIQLWFAFSWFYGIQIFFTPIVNTFGWSRAVISGAFSLQRLEGSILSPIEGFLVDRIGPRKIMLPGIIIAGLGLVGMSYLQSMWMFYFLVLFISAGFGAAMGVPRTWTVVQWFRKKRGRALGIMSSGAAIAGPMVFIIVWLVEEAGWRGAFTILGIATWIVCIPLVLLFRAKPEQYGQLPDGEDIPESSSLLEATSDEEESLSVMEALQTRSFWMLTLLWAAQTMGTNGMAIHQIP